MPVAPADDLPPALVGTSEDPVMADGSPVGLDVLIDPRIKAEIDGLNKAWKNATKARPRPITVATFEV